MKKFLLLISFLTGFAYAQSFVQNSISFPTCYGSCNGTVVLSTTTTAGPFTAVISNTSGCTNSTVQSSTGNTITIGGLCACASDYSINIYNSSMVLVGYELLQVPITATSALVLQSPTVIPTACSSCCSGSVYVSFSGGYTPSTNYTVTLDGSNTPTYNPISNVCAGTHTVCVTDQANCIVCNTFSVGFGTNVNSNSLEEIKFTLSPNPAHDKINISFSGQVPNTIRLIDLSGKTIFAQNLDSNSQTNRELEISTIPAGIYVVEASGTFGIARQKLIKLE